MQQSKVLRRFLTGINSYSLPEKRLELLSFLILFIFFLFFFLFKICLGGSSAELSLLLFWLDWQSDGEDCWGIRQCAVFICTSWGIHVSSWHDKDKFLGLPSSGGAKCGCQAKGWCFCSLLGRFFVLQISIRFCLRVNCPKNFPALFLFLHLICAHEGIVFIIIIFIIILWTESGVPSGVSIISLRGMVLS